jgi:uncharacterized protein
MLKITKVSHVRELSDLERQAFEMALESLNDDANVVLSLGTENGVPFVALMREGSKREVVIHFRDKDKTAETRREEEAGKSSAAKPSTSRPAAKKATTRKR